jgi:hypothetical protein
MITARLNGGLGNQLFQYAAARAQAERLGVDLQLDITELLAKGIKSTTKRDYGLDNFNISARFNFFSRLGSKSGLSWLAFFLSRLSFAWKKQTDSALVEEKLFSYDDRVEKIKNNCELSGYWQNQDYFLAIRGKLLEELLLKKSLSANNLSLLEKIRSGNSIAVHIRRGDYLEYGGKVCGRDYYEQAFALVKEKIISPSYYFFSDDLPWAREAFKHLGAIFVDGNEKSPEADLVLMSVCKHQIIANSSFSWWGAWLNSNLEKMVIAPGDWLGGVSRGIIPEDWLKL